MRTEEQLKELLSNSKANHWEIPEGVELYELSIECLKYIGTIDPVLRDDLIYEWFCEVIENNKLSHEQMRVILEQCLSETHLFYGVGKVEDDSVFTRTFTMLVIELILEKDNMADEAFLSEREVRKTYQKVMEYTRSERDFRGYVEEKGWAHSTAHMADTLHELALSRYLGHEEILEIMGLIKNKICINTYTYINKEEERLLTAFEAIFSRNLVTSEEIIKWLEDFIAVKAEEKYPAKEHLRENRKLFLRAFYFRAKKLNLEEKIMHTIEEILKLPICS